MVPSLGQMNPPARFSTSPSLSNRKRHLPLLPTNLSKLGTWNLIAQGEQQAELSESVPQAKLHRYQGIDVRLLQKEGSPLPKLTDEATGSAHSDLDRTTVSTADGLRRKA